MGKRMGLVVAVVGLMFVGTGCATLRGTEQKMKIDTDPSGATLTMNGQSYSTPAEVKLKRKETQRITIAKAGYRPISFDFAATWDGASMTDLALPGGSALMGASVVTGSDRHFNQLERIKLQPTSEPSPKVLELYQYRGRLLTKTEFDKAVEAEQKDTSRFMGPANN